MNHKNKELLKLTVEEKIADNHKKSSLYSSLYEIIRENEIVRRELLENLHQNVQEKVKLMQLTGDLNKDKRKEIIELQIKLRNARMQKINMHVENMSYKEEVIKVRHESKEKDTIIANLQSEIKNLKGMFQRMNTPDHELSSSPPMLRSPTFKTPQRHNSSDTCAQIINTSSPSSNRRNQLPVRSQFSNINQARSEQKQRQKSPGSNTPTPRRGRLPTKPFISDLSQARTERSKSRSRPTTPSMETMNFIENYAHESYIQPKKISVNISKLRSSSQTPAKYQVSEKQDAKYDLKIEKGAFSNLHQVKQNFQRRQHSSESKEKRRQEQSYRHIDREQKGSKFNVLSNKSNSTMSLAKNLYQFLIDKEVNKKIPRQNLTPKPSS